MSASKQKGSRFERAVAEYLVGRGFIGVDRGVLRGAKDQGDLIGLPSWALELKATKQIDLAAAVDEARIEARNAGKPNFAAVIKRRRKPISESYVVVPLAEFTRFLGAE